MKSTPEERIKGTGYYKSGEPFSIHAIAENANLTADQARAVIYDMAQRGLVAREKDRSGDRTDYRWYRVRPETALLRKRWDKQLFASRPWL